MKLEPSKKCYIYLLLTAAETIGLICFSFLPSLEFIRIGPRPGDIEHFAAYAIYGFLLNRTLGCCVERSKHRILLSVVIGSAVGGLCETIQFFIPYRTADVVDWFIDTLGSLAGAALSSRFKDRF